MITVGNRPLFYDLAPQELHDTLLEWGEPSFRWRQVWQGVYQRLAKSPHELTDLPTRLRERLDQAIVFASISVRAITRSKDGGTEKLLLALPDGQAIEAVLMRYRRRTTACISTQAGCAMGCVFCATGQMGFRRHLTAGEIVEQVLLFARQLARQGQRLTNVVVMGMGEPFHNYEATLEAIDRLNDPEGFHFGARRFTISTVGLVPMIERFTRERRHVNLAISLHAADDELRSQLLPINRRYPLEQLLRACRQYVQVSGRRLSFEWALIQDVNDTPQQAEALSGLLTGLNCHVNLIQLNPTRRYSGQASPRERAAAFRQVLERHGIGCTIRLRRGIDIQAGCGQLATESG
ncbi:MAG: 23S rRNA (adenine(2503)-C(2))-methyltransferase RlmN [Chloroflexota bacterium]